MNGLCHGRIDWVVIVDVHILEGLHLERIEVDVQGQQVKWKITDIDAIVEVISLEKLLADDGSFGPETGVVSLVAFVSVGIDEFFEG